uniref:DUF2013 domain-containing protein n=1 Tax=Macrostomum lignano TaxID=282301 RepID=A0A1I8I3Q0_9PLAT
ALNEQLFANLFNLLASEDSQFGDSDESLVQPIADFCLAANSLTGNCETTSSFAALPTHERPLFRALLANQSASRPFTEYLLMVFNRSEDPTALLSHSPPARDSVLQMLIDLFGHESTIGVFYTNDVHVMLEITCRLLDRSSVQCKILPPVLQLLSLFSISRRYGDLLARQSSLREVLRRLLSQEELDSNLATDCRKLLQAVSK